MKKVKHIRTKTKCSVFLGLAVHFLLLILISSTASATLVQNSSVIDPGGYNNSSITGSEGYQNSSVLAPEGYGNSSVKGPYAYIANSDTSTVHIIDTSTNTVTDIVDIETYAITGIWEDRGDEPFGVAVVPDGKKVYVTNSGSSNISVIDTAANNLTAIISVRGNPRGVAVSPDGTKAYVASAYGFRGILSIIDTATDTVTDTVKVGNGPYGVAVTPDGTEVYVTNSDGNTVSVIDTARNKLKATVTVPNILGYSSSHPVGVAINPEGTKAYVTNNYAVSAIDIATKNVTATVRVGYYPAGIAVTLDGKKVYAANSNYYGTVYVIDTATNNVTTILNVGKDPCGVSVTPDGSKVYVTNHENSTLSVISTSTDTVIATVNAGSCPYSFGQFIGPALTQKILPVSNFSSNVTMGYAPLSVQFNDYSENATSVNWDFGDGVNSTEQNPVHTYFAAGDYNVNLTAANENGTNLTFATITALEKPVASWEFSPQEPVSGDILNINGSDFLGEKVGVFATFEKTVPVSKGKFEYIIKDIKIPEGFDNSFSVEATGAKDLNVRVKKLIWITKSSGASGDTAIVSQSNVPAGTYRIKIDGNTRKGVPEVNLKITAFQRVKVDSNGKFDYSYDTTAIPPGNFKISVGNSTKEITIKPEKIDEPNQCFQR